MDWKPYLIGGGIIMALMGGVTLVCVILAYRLYGWWNKAKEERDTAQADLQAEKEVSAARKDMADEAHQEHAKTIARLHETEAQLTSALRRIDELEAQNPLAVAPGVHADDSRDTVPVEAEATVPPVAASEATANGKRPRGSRKRATE